MGGLIDNVPTEDYFRAFELGVQAVEASRKFAVSLNAVSYETARRAQEELLQVLERYPENGRFSEGARICRAWLALDPRTAPEDGDQH